MTMIIRTLVLSKISKIGIIQSSAKLHKRPSWLDPPPMTKKTTLKNEKWKKQSFRITFFRACGLTLVLSYAYSIYDPGYRIYVLERFPILARYVPKQPEEESKNSETFLESDIDVFKKSVKRWSSSGTSDESK
jgi:hypothetical protein